MYDSSLCKDEVSLMIHQVLNKVEGMSPDNAFVPRAKAIVITKLEEALLWLQYGSKEVLFA